MQENNISATQLSSEPVTQIGQQPMPAGEAGKQSNFLVILLSILLFVSVSIAGFFAFQTQKLVKELTLLESEPMPTTSSEPTTDLTVDWKTFTDEKNRFSFRYPSDVEIKNENGRLSMVLPDFDYPVSIIPDGPHNWGEGMAKDQLDKIYMKQFQYPNDPDRKMFPDTDVQFVIEFQTLTDKNKATDFLTKTDQILSTFRFIESDPTANWKTYTNAKYGISYRYPLTWEFTETKEPDVQTWYDANIFQLISPNVVSFDHGEINGGYYLTFNVSKVNPNYSNFQEFLDYSKDQYKYSLTSRKINNIDGYIFTQNGKETGYIFSKNNLFFTINLLTDKDVQTLDQILSTFKFVN